MKHTAKFRRSKFHLWLIKQLGPYVILDELAHLTEEQWAVLNFKVRNQTYDFGPGAVFMTREGSGWVKMGQLLSSSCAS